MAVSKLTTLVLLCSLSLAGCGFDNYAPVDDYTKVTRRPHTKPRTKHPTAKQYRIQRGDTLYSIAFRFGVDFRTLAKANRIAAPYVIHPGSMLSLRHPKPAIKAPVRPQKHASKPRKQSPTHPVKTVRLHWQWPTRGRLLHAFSLPQNKGIDIVGRYTQPIVAASAGTVVYTGQGLRGYGNLIIIKHDDHFLTAYGHNSRLLVRQGARVKKGQRIALMGRTLNATPNLHFEIRHNGKPVNPLRYLPSGKA